MKLKIKIIILLLLHTIITNGQVSPPENAIVVNQPDGDRFWIAAADEPGTHSNIIASGKGADLFNGQNNNNSGGNAIAVCKNKGNGWYLPSQTEANSIYFTWIQRCITTYDALGFYWSSSSFNGTHAYVVYLANGSLYAAAKGNTAIVRCAWRP